MPRACGDCQKCCTLVPVRDKRTGLDKGGGVRCRHQSYAKGCGVYGTQAMPQCCTLWSCRWLLAQPGTENLSRPDRAGYVIDVMPDYITARDVDGREQHIEIVQVWLDPRRPAAHKDKALREYLAGLAAENIAALIRVNMAEAFVLLAPNMNDTGDWLEIRTTQRQVEHSAADIVQKLGGMTITLVEERPGA